MVTRVEVVADRTGEWCHNQLTFPSVQAAVEYARDLAWRWTMVERWRVTANLFGTWVEVANG